MNGVLLQGVWLCSWLACLQASDGTKQQKNKTKKKFLFITSCVIVSTTIYEYLELFVEELLMQWTTSISHFFGFNKLSVYIWMHAVFFLLAFSHSPVSNAPLIQRLLGLAPALSE